MKALQVGALVQSSINYDRGSVLKRTDIGILVRWSTGIREFVLFSESESVMAPRGTPASMCQVQRQAMLRRQLLERDDTPPDEQERILEEIARLRAEARPNETTRAKPCNANRHRAKHYRRSEVGA